MLTGIIIFIGIALIVGLIMLAIWGGEGVSLIRSGYSMPKPYWVYWLASWGVLLLFALVLCGAIGYGIEQSIQQTECREQYFTNSTSYATYLECKKG